MFVALTFGPDYRLLVFFLVEEEVFFAGIVGPEVLYAFIGIAFVFHFL